MTIHQVMAKSGTEKAIECQFIKIVEYGRRDYEGGSILTNSPHQIYKLLVLF